MSISLMQFVSYSFALEYVLRKRKSGSACKYIRRQSGFAVIMQLTCVERPGDRASGYLQIRAMSVHLIRGNVMRARRR